MSPGEEELVGEGAVAAANGKQQEGGRARAGVDGSDEGGLGCRC